MSGLGIGAFLHAGGFAQFLDLKVQPHRAADHHAVGFLVPCGNAEIGKQLAGADLVGDAVDYMVENCPVEITFIEGNPAVMVLPSSVVLTVTNAPEGVKGDSTTNVMKTITLETGKTIQAPLFIKTGERLKVDTRHGKYMERVNK